jgi:hypothetical protein
MIAAATAAAHGPSWAWPLAALFSAIAVVAGGFAAHASLKGTNR